MSLELCVCGKFIDTDEDCAAYTVMTDDCATIYLAAARCESCRDDIIDLMGLHEKCDEFTQEIFDFVRLVGDVGMLDRMDVFRRNVENTIMRLKGVSND